MISPISIACDREKSSPGDPAALATAVPLCVDLDRTLLGLDLAVESAITLLHWRVLQLLGPRRSWSGALPVGADPSLLPYDMHVLSWLRRERLRGRSLVLVTKAPENVVMKIAEYLGIFDGIVADSASGGVRLERLRGRFGAAFDYVGSTCSDLCIWKVCRQAVVVNASRRVLRHAIQSADVVRVFDYRVRSLGLWITCLRPHQWIKNVLIFVPLIAAHSFAHWAPFIHAFLGFCAFCLCASGAYILNDLSDLDSDRRHPDKCERPFASGRVPALGGLIAAVTLVAAGFGIAAFLPAGVLLLLVTYFGLTVLYSIALKRIELVDVFTLASLYSLRIFVGQEATGIAISGWLLPFSMLLFLSLGFCKRASELQTFRARHVTQLNGRHYRTADLEQINLFGVVCGFLATPVLALYMQSDNVRVLYSRPQILWMLVPLLLYWVSRTWLLTSRGEMHGDPVLFAVKDCATWITALCAAIIVVAAI